MRKLTTQINTLFGPMVICDTDIKIGVELKKFGSWDLHDLTRCIKLFEKNCTNPRGIILDVGSNMGTWSLPLARLYADCNIHAFECQSLLFNCFVQTLGLNKIENVTPHLCAVSDVDGVIEYPSINYEWGSNFGAFELEPVKNSDFNGVRLPDQVTKVDSRTIDSFNFENVNLIKIDTEGMEYKVIKGALKTLQRCKSVVLFENHKTDYAGVLALLGQNGYHEIERFGQMSCAIFKSEI